MPLFNAAAPRYLNQGAVAKTANVMWGPAMSGAHSTPSVTVSPSIAMNSALISYAALMAAPKAGVLDRIGINVSAKTGTPPAYKVGFVTYDSSFSPTTTPAGASALVNWQPAATGWFWITLASPLTVTAGQIVCASIFTGATPADAGNTASLSSHNTMNGETNLPQVQQWNGTTWTRFANTPAVGIRYSVASGDDVGNAGASVTSAIGPTFTSATNPNTRGAKFQVPVPMTCYGAQIHLRATGSAAGTETIQLLDAADTVLASTTLPPGVSTNTTNWYQHHVHWSGVALLANTDYRIAVLATTTDTRQLVEVIHVDQPSAGAYPEATRWQLTTRQDAGAWTDNPLIIPMIGIWVNSLVA